MRDHIFLSLEDGAACAERKDFDVFLFDPELVVAGMARVPGRVRVGVSVPPKSQISGDVCRLSGGQRPDCDVEVTRVGEEGRQAVAVDV